MIKVAAVFAVMVFFMDASTACGETRKSGTIVVEQNKHIMIFKVISKKGIKFIDGLMDEKSVKIDDIKSVNFDGTVDAETSTVTVINKTKAVAVISGTAREGEGKWTVKMKTGKMFTLDPSRFHFKGIKVDVDEGGNVFYGDDIDDITPPPALPAPEPAPDPKKTIIDFVTLTVC